MSNPPANPKIYHITHLDNLPAIVNTGEILSDARMLEMNHDCTVIGMSDIKRRRLEDIQVSCHPDTRVGEYVPFYFCPRSIMLYILYRANHPDLAYRGGQRPIIHLQADLYAVIQWAQDTGRLWAISDRNAGTYVAEFYNQRGNLNEIDWQAVASADFRSTEVREGKQAEFLIHELFPWKLVERIGVIDARAKDQAEEAIGPDIRKSLVNVEPEWYY
ncbi:MAG: DUF4433 domain-containing protein [Phycisphaerales bacterium]|jgi:hypothetical protein|nr:DUF4433 domain-containing protein [Phycisphaerales bacterium]